LKRSASTVRDTPTCCAFRLREGRFSAFPVQVRLAYTGLLLVSLWGPMNWLFWVPAIGTIAQVLFGYCTLARCLSLRPGIDSSRFPGVWSGVRSPPHR
jgi:hypothetical protein